LTGTRDGCTGFDGMRGVLAAVGAVLFALLPSSPPARAGIAVDADHLVGFRIGVPGLPGVGNVVPPRFNLRLDDPLVDDAAPDDPENYEVKGKATSLLVAARKNTEPAPSRPELRYLRYALTRARHGAGPATPGGDFPPAAKHVSRRWKLDNQLGDIFVDSRKVTALLVPAAAAPPGDAAPTPLPADDTHYLCYKIKAARVSSGQTRQDKFRTDLGTFLREADFDDCAGDAFVASHNPTMQGACFYDVKKPVELCNPVVKSDVEPPRETSAPPGMTSTPATGNSLLCYKIKLARKVRGPEGASLLGVPIGTKVDPAQTKHAKTPGVQTAPSNRIPGPVQVDTKKSETVCVPSAFLGFFPIF
jgi:hypothetical protein